MRLCWLQRQASLSTLQSKAAKRRDDAQKLGPRVAAKKATNYSASASRASNSTVSKAVNGFTAGGTTPQRGRLDDQLELEIIQVDALQTPGRKRVSSLKFIFLHNF